MRDELKVYVEYAAELEDLRGWMIGQHPSVVVTAVPAREEHRDEESSQSASRRKTQGPQSESAARSPITSAKRPSRNVAVEHTDHLFSCAVAPCSRSPGSMRW